MEVATPRETQAVWKQVFAGNNLNILPAITETAEQAQDILIDDESKDYTKRMNRWQRESTDAILSTDFWLQLYIQRSRRPLARALHVLEKADPLGALNMFGVLPSGMLSVLDGFPMCKCCSMACCSGPASVAIVIKS